MQQLGQTLGEKGMLPDALIQFGIRRLLDARLSEIQADSIEMAAVRRRSLMDAMAQSPVALVPEKANGQHYELPPAFFEHVLGRYRKYSCAFWDAQTHTLEDAERNGLSLTCEHADLRDGMDILELGCGWGSLTLWMARRFPNSRITAVSNSHSQRVYIARQAAERGLDNVNVLTADMNDFATTDKFDRVLSVEMFEHMRNWAQMFDRVGMWLRPSGKFFLHIFVHRSTPYLFENNDESDWMSRWFFSGGMMPSADLPLHFQDKLQLRNQWVWDGRHYGKTSYAWLDNMDRNREAVKRILADVYGQDQLTLWWMRWRMFFMACAELFNYRQGQEWFVGHYLFSKANLPEDGHDQHRH